MPKKLVMADFFSVGSTGIRHCMVCSESFSDEDIVYRLPCNKSHVFHISCIYQHIASYGPSCPKCWDIIPESIVAEIRNEERRTSTITKERSANLSR